MSDQNNKNTLDASNNINELKSNDAVSDNHSVNKTTASIENPEPALAAAAQAALISSDMPAIATSKVQDASEFGKVAVIYGGSSNERSVSLDSGAAVLQSLQSQGVDASHFDPKHQEITELLGYDRVFNVLHGRGGEDGVLQGMLQWLSIPQTGSGILASALGMDKVRTKQLWQGCGLSTAPFSLLTADTDWQQVVDNLMATA